MTLDIYVTRTEGTLSRRLRFICLSGVRHLGVWALRDNLGAVHSALYLMGQSLGLI